ncbi:MAG: hypothetical protein PHU51_05830 [Candidatus Nanoarchaeia archaeon]|jgi:membrane-associated HD superfamily phosphohydrolase|nr:hypothetical protein [Candidatus Nanoarchaeia archaeon]
MHTKNFLPILTFVLIVVVSLLYAANRTESNFENNMSASAIMLTDIQISACNAAQVGGTCKTKLPELNLVQPKDCCRLLGKCC